MAGSGARKAALGAAMWRNCVTIEYESTRLEENLGTV
jgi:hypothetical protein